MRSGVGIVAAGFIVGLSLAVVAFGARTPPPEPVPDMAMEAADAAESVCVPAPLPERAAQVLVVGLPDTFAPHHPMVSEITDLDVGGVLITEPNVYNAAQVRRLIAALREGIEHPLLVTTDEEPGRVSHFTPVLGEFSPARTMAERGIDEIEIFATQFGTELRTLDIDLLLGPVLDLDGGPASGYIGDRAFSDDPQEASRYALAYTQGLMAGGVMAGPKHFPGHGRASGDSQRRIPVVDASTDELHAHDLVPFAAHIRLGVPLVELGHVRYSALDDELPASLSPHAYRLLRGLGFEGVAMPDLLGAASIRRHWDLEEAVILALSAGADAVAFVDGTRARAVHEAIVEAVEQGRLDQERLSEAAGRMFALKGGDARQMTCVEQYRRGVSGVGRAQ